MVCDVTGVSCTECQPGFTFSGLFDELFDSLIQLCEPTDSTEDNSNETVGTECEVENCSVCSESGVGCEDCELDFTLTETENGITCEHSEIETPNFSTC